MTKKNLTRIGVFGGTFDPPHVGHLMIADQAVRQLKLDRVIFVPAYLPPHKKKGTAGSPSQRFTMIKKAIAGNRAFEVTPLEIERKGISYTIDTLRAIKVTYEDARLFLIVGGDNYRQFRKWKSADYIRKLASLVVYDRVDSRGIKDLRTMKGVVLLEGGSLNVSSTSIRQKVQRGESIRFLVPPSVERFIRRERMYLSAAPQ